ncbi:ATP-binding cassette domain-containing protein [Gemella sp. zg-570]|uniref:ABC transporter ATP-binding protein n=1 Tax=Gemella sp. zg-570 TaxID=2840371 RepID=UPI001C0DCA85|nr:ATP-binding cassette domain-containing protein [Gemella sp. zg-570]QWQ39173.1 ATP-binding cassette domain-containing protein [Gemella sp. zg-570]
MNFIEINNVNKTFFKNTNREHHALKNINLKINRGDFITIVGGNGAGKSTLLNALSGNFLVDSGKIFINNIDVSLMSEHKRSKYISRVFQNPLYGTAPRMTVCENMALAYRRGEKRGLKLGVTEENKKYFTEQLSSLNLGLENRLHTEIGLLSGGQRQAISLLMATIKNPDLLLLDEHTAALDLKTQKIIMDITDKKIKDKNITALMITHNIQDALKYGNRLIVLNQGEIIKDFNKEEKEVLTRNDIYNILDEL